MKRSMTKLAVAATAALAAAGWSNSASAADSTFTGGGTGGGTAWLTATNWSAGIPGTTETATIGTTTATSAIGVNMNSSATNNGANNQAVGQIIYDAGASRSLINSAGSVAGTLTLNGVGGQLLSNITADKLFTINNGASTATLNLAFATSGTINVSNADAGITILNNTSGAGNITKTGAGVLTLAGSNTFGTGPGPTLTVSAGTLRSGANTTSSVAGAVQVDTAAVDVGGTGTFGTFTLGGLAANNGSSFNFDLGSGNQDLIDLGANALALGAGTETINIAGTGFAPGDYTLLSYGSKSGGSFTLGSTPTGSFTYNLLTNANATILQVLSANALRTWTGAVNGNWNTTTANWSGAGSTFANGDFVTFDDSGNNTAITIQAGGVKPQTVTFANATKDYSFTGGSMSDSTAGPTPLTKDGAGKVSLLNTNTITGPVAINEGTLAIGSGAALGNVSGISITNNAVLQAAGAVITDRAINFSTGGGTIDSNGNDVTVNTAVTGTSLAT
jgi:autotransporter-associated beta strand protein